MLCPYQILLLFSRQYYHWLGSTPTISDTKVYVYSPLFSNTKELRNSVKRTKSERLSHNVAGALLSLKINSSVLSHQTRARVHLIS